MTAELTQLEEFTEPCQTCDQHRWVVRARGDVAVARVCEDCFAECPACHGEKFRFETDERGYEFAVRCPVCSTLDDRVAAFNAAGIPAKYHAIDCALENFQRYEGPGTKGKIGNLVLVHKRIYQWVKGFVPGERGFLLHGGVGTGKTHLMAAALRYLTLEKGVECRFVEFTHLLSDIKQQFDQGRGEAAVLGPVISHEVLAIDELGKGRRNEWQVGIADEIISKRYNRGLTTLFTTNYPVETPDDGLDEDLRQRIGDRIFSRLHEMADFIHIDAPDFRTKK